MTPAKYISYKSVVCCVLFLFLALSVQVDALVRYQVEFVLVDAGSVGDDLKETIVSYFFNNHDITLLHSNITIVLIPYRSPINLLNFCSEFLFSDGLFLNRSFFVLLNPPTKASLTRN